jgi:UDP-3-O-[3-hydroxymyristoyl] glucosamine N-acyltransferase|tara:strand:- start:7598 stop:8623 length:1026 start_codon:yes stop_codon:yes gene_type:complete
VRLSEVAERLGAVLEGDASLEVAYVNSLEKARPGEISFLSSDRYRSLLEKSQATAVLVPAGFEGSASCALLRVKNPDRSFGEAAALFYEAPPTPVLGIHPSAVVAESVVMGAKVSIGPNCTVEGCVTLGEGVVIGSNSVVGYGSRLGDEVHLHASVTLREFSEVGDRVMIHSGTVIGSDGFGYSVEPDGSRRKIPQVGIVVIEDDVEIGSNVSVDRARFGKTVIGRGTKIDNLVQVAHNVTIGSDCVLCGQVGIAGSAKIGSKTILAGQVGVAGHLTVGDGVIANAKSGIVNDLEEGTHVMGMPAVPQKEFQRGYLGMLKLGALREKIRMLEKKINSLIDK